MSNKLIKIGNFECPSCDAKVEWDVKGASREECILSCPSCSAVFHVHFAQRRVEELISISFSDLEKMGYELTDKAKAHFKTISS